MTAPAASRTLGFCRRCSRPIEQDKDGRWRDVQGSALCGMGVYDHSAKYDTICTVPSGDAKLTQADVDRHKERGADWRRRLGFTDEVSDDASPQTVPSSEESS